MINDSISEKVSRRVRASGRRYWTAAELRAGAESSAAVWVAIHRLVKDGELRRVRRGLYWHAASTSDARAKSVRVRTAATAARKALPSGEAVGASGWQAANALGLSTQLSPVEVMAVTARVPRQIEGVRFVDRSSRRGRRTQHLSELEVTILEAIEGWEKYIEVDNAAAAARFVELLLDDRVRCEVLVRASRTEPASVRERLRELMSRAGKNDLAQRIERAADTRTQYRALKVFNS